MTLLVLIILAVIWAAVLVPPYLQNRSEGRPASSISSFQKQLSVLERRSGGLTSGPLRPAVSAARPIASRPVAARYAPVRQASLRMSRAEAKKRRRDILFTLAAAAGITLLMALFLGGPTWGLNLLCDALFGGYVYLLVQVQQHAAERDVKVRYLPQRNAGHAAEPQLLLRRSGS